MNEKHSVSLVNDVTGEALFPVTPKKRKKPINKEAIAGTIFASGPLLGFIQGHREKSQALQVLHTFSYFSSLSLLYSSIP